MTLVRKIEQEFVPATTGSQEKRNSVSVAPAESQVHNQADDVQHLLASYQHEALHYHEIRRRENLKAIRNRWPLLSEIGDTL